MKANLAVRVIETKVFACPECGADSSSYGHLKPGNSFGPWYCDECGFAVTGKIETDGSVELSPHYDRQITTLVLLQLFQPLQNGDPVYLIVKGMAFVKEGEPLAIGEHDEYYYNEHTCPWNYLRVPIIHKDDVDPHGIFQHQETIVEPTQDQYRKLLGKECLPLNGDNKVAVNRLEFKDLQKLFPTLRSTNGRGEDEVAPVQSDSSST